MQLRRKELWSTALLVALAAGLSAQTPTPPRQGEQPTFTLQIDLVTTDVIARDASGNFVPSLTKDDFEVYEDGVKQDIVSVTLSHGGRVTNVLVPELPPSEGIVLPRARAAADPASGRIFVFFVDDLHMQFQNTLRIREIFRQAVKLLVHDGDMFAMVSSGPSSIAVQLTYDKKRLDEAINKIMGSELKPEEIINGPTGPSGPTELRWRAHVAMSTVSDLLDNLEKVHNRRKALVYVSDGYDFAPFKDARLGLMDPNSPFLQNNMMALRNASAYASAISGSASPTDPNASGNINKEGFAGAELAVELAAITRIANRANTTIYTIDPRGLVGGPDIDQSLEITQWHDYIQKSQDTLRTLAEETGGIAILNQNDYNKALKRIDAETSDYYVLGYYSKNPDPRKMLRKIDVRVTRKDVEIASRKEYMVKTPPPPGSSKK